MTEARKPGRPRIAEGIRMTVNLDAQTVEHAKALGEGNVSRGLRRAVLQVSAQLKAEALEPPGIAGPDAGESPVLELPAK